MFCFFFLAVVIGSRGSKLTYNMVSNLQWTGSYNGRAEEFNWRFEAGIDIYDAEDVQLEGNYVVGSEKAGYKLSGDACVASGRPVYNEIKSNMAAVNLMGIALLPTYKSKREDCNMFSGFKLWKNIDYGMYYNNENSFLLSGSVLADNQVDLFSMMIGPSALGHICEHKTAEVTQSVVIGRTSSMDCSEEKPSDTMSYYSLSNHCRGVSGPGGEKLGILFPLFTEKTNKAPVKPCANVQASNSLCGTMKISSKFSNYPDIGIVKEEYSVIILG